MSRLQTEFHDGHFQAILENQLFVGPAVSATKLDQLTKANIRFIINVTAEHPCYHPTEITYLHRKIIDDSNTEMLEIWDDSCVFIDTAIAKGAAVLVHCSAGISRSVSVVLAYLIKNRRMPLKSALHLVRSSRPIASPNIGFMRQLCDWEQQHLGCSSMNLIDCVVDYTSQTFLELSEDQLRKIAVQCHGDMSQTVDRCVQVMIDSKRWKSST